MRPENSETRTTEGKTPSLSYPSANDSSLPDRMRILVVDDNPTNRKLLRVLLEAEGHSVIEADNGVSALERLNREQLDAVISDILMPEMDGFRLCYEIRSSAKLKTLPFIIYTATYTSALDEKAALDFGADNFIRKPASHAEILDALHEATRGTNGRRAKQLEEPQKLLAMRAYSEALVKKLEENNLKLTEANGALAESESHLRIIFDSEPECVKIIDRDGAIVQLNRAGLRMFEADSAEQIVGKSVYSLIVPEHRQAFREITEAVSRAESRRLEFEIVGLKGTRRWLETHAVPFKNANGEIISSLAITRDITESKRAEEALGQIQLKDIQGINTRIVKELGIIFVLSVFIFAAEAHFELFEVFVDWVFAHEEISLDGLVTVFVFLPFAFVFFSYRRWKELKAYLGGRRKAEEALRALHGELEIRVQERTADLSDSNEALRAEVTERKQAQEMAQRNLNRIRALHEIDLAITSTLDLPTVLQVLLEKIEVFFPYPTATTVRLLNQKTGELEALACHNIDRDEWRNSFSIAPGKRARRVLDSKKPQIVRNVAIDPESASSSLYRNNGLVSHVGVPLIARSEALGVLNLYTREEHEFGAEEIEFLMTLAGQAAIAIHNAQLYEETERRRREAEELARLARSLTETLDMTVVGERIVTSVRELFGVQGSTLRLRQANGSFRRLASSGEGFSQTAAGDAVPSGVGLTSRALAGGRPVWSSDTLNDPEIILTDEMRDYQIRSGNRSMIAVPLRAHEKLVGALTLSDRTGRTYAGTEVSLLQTFADQAALALENARHYEQTERHLKRIQGVSEINNAIASTLSLKNVLEVLLEKTELFCPIAGACGVRLFDEATGHTVPLAVRNIPFEEWRQEVANATGRLTQLLVETKRPLAILNMHTDSRTSMNNFASRYGLVSYLGVPLIVRDQFIGTLVIYTKEEHVFSAEEIDFFSNLGSQAAIAIHNAQLHEQTERHLKRIEALREIDKAITSTLDLSTILNVLVEKLEVFFTYPSVATVRLFDKDTGVLEPVAARNIEIGEWITAMRGVQRNEKSYGKLVLEQAVPLVVANLQTDPRTQQPDFYRERGLISYAGVPLKAKGEVLGVLSIYTKEEHAFSNEEIELLMILAGQAAIAIHNAWLFQKNESTNRQLETNVRFLDKSLKQIGSLYTAMTPLTVSESFVGMVNEIIARLVEATGADAALIRLWNKNADTYPVIGQRGYAPRFIEQIVPNQNAGAVGWVMTHGEPIIAPIIAADSRLGGKRQLKLGFQSCAFLPLTIHGEVRGVIQLSSRTLRYFDEEQKDHFMAIARQMSIALENREMFFNLQTSRNELERSNKVKDEFLSVMSHELRTPLSVVTGYSAMLRQEQLGPLTSEQEHALNVIQRNSQELYTMIDSIMDATKIETGSIVTEIEPVSLPQLLSDIKVGYDCPNAKNIRLQWNFSDALPPLWTDARKLRQILTNLVNNAIKFTDEGSVVISADEKIEAETGGHRQWIEFRIADSGIGIPPEAREKIFERFHQVDGSGTRSFEGVGIGLYIVKSFTEMLGGQVSVESVVGKGSTFTVSVPLRIAPKGGSTRPSPPPPD
jgi:PAS domain S-box-containing protein